MRTWIFASVWLSAAVAHADPAGLVSKPSACKVDVVRAPDDVRDAVQGWVGGELRCSVALEVRIVKTDGGLYVLARDDRGRTFERIVPDADSAGVLIASWAADDQVAATPASVAPGDVAPAIAASAPVSVAPGDVAPAIAASAPAPVQRHGARRAIVAATYDTRSDGTGVRVQLDAWSHGRWIAGAALSGATVAGTEYPGDVYRTTGAAAIAYVGARLEGRDWSIAPAIGAGVAATHFAMTDPIGDPSGDDTVRPLTEASVTVTRAIGLRLELTASVLGDWQPRGWHDPQPIALVFAAGLGFRL